MRRKSPSGGDSNTATAAPNGVDCVIGSWRGVTGAREITAGQILYWRKLLEAATATAEWKGELDRHHWSAMPLYDGLLWDHLERERAEMRAILEQLGLLKRTSPGSEG